MVKSTCCCICFWVTKLVDFIEQEKVQSPGHLLFLALRCGQGDWRLERTRQLQQKNPNSEAFKSKEKKQKS